MRDQQHQSVHSTAVKPGPPWGVCVACALPVMCPAPSPPAYSTTAAASQAGCSGGCALLLLLLEVVVVVELLLLSLLSTLLPVMAPGAGQLHYKLLRQLLLLLTDLPALDLTTHLQTTAAQLPVLHGDRHCCWRWVAICCWRLTGVRCGCTLNATDFHGITTERDKTAELPPDLAIGTVRQKNPFARSSAVFHCCCFTAIPLDAHVCLSTRPCCFPARWPPPDHLPGWRDHESGPAAVQCRTGWVYAPHVSTHTMHVLV